MHGQDVDNDAVIVNRVNEAMLTVDAPGPHASKRMPQGLGLADASVELYLLLLRLFGSRGAAV